MEFSASVGFIHKESVNDAWSYDRKNPHCVGVESPVECFFLPVSYSAIKTGICSCTS